MKKEKTYVIGHKNPDTDSICSAIAMAQLKRAEGMEGVRAARAGDLNPQTAFILDYFGVEPPLRLHNVYPKAVDIMSTDIRAVGQDTPVMKVMDMMRENQIRFVPVLSNDGLYMGALSLMDLANMYIEKVEAGGARAIRTTLKNIKETLGATILHDFTEAEEKEFYVYVGAMAKDSFATILSFAGPKDCIVIVGDRMKIQQCAVDLGVGLIIVSGGLEVSDEVIRRAGQAGVSLIVSPFDSATTALFVRLSVPASLICLTEFETASPNDLAEDLKYKLSEQNGIVVLEDGKLAGIITKTDLLNPSGTSLILVDHNELSQAVDGADRVNIAQVIDHHRIGNFTSSYAIPFICEPLGATSSIVSELYRRSGYKISKTTASLLLSGVVSDTVILKSPTTTDRDREVVKWLEQESGLDHKELGALIFTATSSLKKRGAKAVVMGDHKVFEAKGKNFGIGQVETIGFSEFYEEEIALTEELNKAAVTMDLALSAILITDIVLGSSLLLAVGDKKVLYSLGYTKLKEGVYELKDVLSRKKQVVPHIISLFNDIF